MQVQVKFVIIAKGGTAIISGRIQALFVVLQSVLLVIHNCISNYQFVDRISVCIFLPYISEC